LPALLHCTGPAADSANSRENGVWERVTPTE